MRDQIPADLSFGAPSTALTYQKTLIPVSDNAYDLGTTTQRWRNLYVSGTCTGCGGDAGSISTSSPGVISSLLYFTTAAATPELVDPVATTTLTASSPLSLSNPVVKVGGSNSVLTIATTTNSLFTGIAGQMLGYTNLGWIGVATTTAGTGLTYTGSAFNVDLGTAIDISGETNLTAGDGLTLTDDDLDCDTSSATIFGCLASADWTTFNNKVATSRTLTIAGTANQITSSAGAQDLSADRTWTLSLPSHVVFPGNFQATNATTTNATTTSSFYSSNKTFLETITSAIALTGADGLVAEYTGTTCTNQFVRVLSALGVATCATVGTADVAGLDISDDTNLTVTWPVILTGDALSFGGLSTSSAAIIGNLPYYSGVNTFANVATGTASCTTGASCTSFTVIGSSPSITTTLGTSIDLAAEVTGDLPFANLAQVAANSVLGNNTGATADAASIATSTLFGATVTGGYVLTASNGAWISAATSTCAQITGSADLCDGGDSEGSASPEFTSALYNSVIVNATSTGIWFKALSPFSLIASSTFATQASSSQLTNSGSTWLAGLTSALVSADANGLLGEYAGVDCTNQLVIDISAAGTGTCTSINNDFWSGTDLAVLNGGTGVSTFGGTNTILYTTAADTLSSEAALTYDPAVNLLTLDSILSIASSTIGGATNRTGLTINGSATTTLSATTTINQHVGGNLSFNGEIMPDTLLCANGEILKKTGANDWDCAADSEGSASPEFTSALYNSVIVNATSTGIWFKAISPFSLIATSTFVTQASSTQLTNSGSTWLTGLTSALVSADSAGLLGEYGGAAACTNQFVTALDAAGASTCASINNAQWSGTDLAVANGGTGLSTFGGTNLILYTTATDALASEAGFTYTSTNAQDLLTVTNATTTALTISSFLLPPTGTAPANFAAGSLAFDTTSGNLIMGTSTSAGVVIASATSTLYAFSIASTSPDLASGGVIELPPHFLAQTAAEIGCKVDGGTSWVINLSDTGTNDTNAVTCTTTWTQYKLTSNNQFTASEAIRIEGGTLTGAVDYAVVRIIGWRISD